MIKAAGLLALALFTLGPVSAQRSVERIAGEMRGFEREWLTAYLNEDRGWLSRFSTGKLNVMPAPDISFESRGGAVSELRKTDVRANEMKVRISGTISLLTNDPKLNRSFFFLDTFNKINGKWEVIASSISATPATGAQQVREELLRLESELAQAIVKSDLATFERVIATEFVSTSFDGRIEDRRQWIESRSAHRVKSAVLREMKVNLAGDDVAVVTGIITSDGLDSNENEISYSDRFTHTWAKTGGRWQCIAAQLTRVK
jgi:ketosteroid isomerase-like protein